MKLFGTDGIRGTVNQFPIEPLGFVKLAQSIGQFFKQENKDSGFKVLIGKDTRESGYMIECALVSGLVSLGIDVMLVGPIPTPGISFLTRSMRANLGIMISASHNPFHDNGIKIFNAEGMKLDKKTMQAIEEIFWKDEQRNLSSHVGKAKRVDDATGRYIEYLKNFLNEEFRLDGTKVVIDCANGAAYKTAPTVLRELGAEVTVYEASPNGQNINDRCGAVHPEYIRNLVLKHKSHVGISLDGDADRVALIDEKGREIPSENIIAFLALYYGERIAVTTKIANPALERFLKDHEVEVIYTDVGDTHVLCQMSKEDAYVGGEPSGHILLLDQVGGSDGLLIALICLQILKETGEKISWLHDLFTLDPFEKESLFLEREVYDKWDNKKLETLIKKENFKSKFVVRKSGTETVIRLQAWLSDEKVLMEEFSKAKEMILGHGVIRNQKKLSS